MTYDEFKTRIATMAATDLSLDVDMVAIMPTMIDAAERRCIRDLDPLALRGRATLTTAIGNASPTGLPSDWWIPRRLVLAGPPRTEIRRRALDFVEFYAPDPTATGTPKYWAMQNDIVVTLAPVPSAVLSVLADYTAKPAGLSASTTTTWLSTNYADMLLYAAMIFLAGYQKNYSSGADDAQMAGTWTAQYTTALAAARIEEALKKGRGPFEPPPTAPPSSGAPS